MMCKIFPFLLVLILTGTPVYADLIQLDFLVEIDQKWEGSGYTDPDITYNYTVIVDTDPTDAWTDTTFTGGMLAQTWFPSSTIPETDFTEEVLVMIDDPFEHSWDSVGISREYNPTGFGSGVPETFEAIWLTYDGYTPVIDDEMRNYQRGLQRQMVIGDGDLTMTFDSLTYLSYMESLIGDSNFYFQDAFIITEFFPETESSMTTGQYGYAGYATLTAVSSVPEPASMFLFGTGIAGVIGARFRQKKK